MEVVRGPSIPTKWTSPISWPEEVLDQILKLQALKNRAVQRTFTPVSPPQFGKWLSGVLSRAGAVKPAELARIYNERAFQRLRPNTRDARRSEKKRGAVSLPKKEMAQYLRGRCPGPIVSYRIGRSIEELCNNRFLKEYFEAMTAEISKPEYRFEHHVRECGLVVDVTGLIEGLGMQDSCSGIDALIAAGHWSEAIACIGEYINIKGGLSFFEFSLVFKETLANQSRSASMPRWIYPSLDDAWIRWISNPDPRRLPSRIAAAYILWKTGKAQDRFEATQILKGWLPNFSD